MATYRNPRSGEDDAKRQAEADQAALERLYGSKKSEFKLQWGVGIALLVLGPVLILAGAAMGGEGGMIAVGVLALAVGLWAFIDGLVRGSKAKSGDDRSGR